MNICYVNRLYDSVAIIRLLKENYKCSEFNIKKTNNVKSTLQIEELQIFKKTIDTLKERGYSFHTFTPKSEKLQTFLLKVWQAIASLKI